MAKKQFTYVDFCQNCRKVMQGDDKIVYVEEGSNRFFCSEKCIREYYDPVSEHYRAALAELRDPHDIADTDFPKYESYGPLCLSNPDEIWVDTSEHGETFFYFIGNYSNESGKFAYVVMCFCLELEPTYILMAFPTRDKKLLAGFRRGKKIDPEEVEMEAAEQEIPTQIQEDLLANQGKALEEEMLRHRQKDDVPASEFDDYSHLLEQTIEAPDEVWELQDEKESPILTLISQPEESLYYVVICTFEPGAIGEGAQESWRVIFNFPTKDQSLVQRYRRGVIREGNDGTTKFLH